MNISTFAQVPSYVPTNGLVAWYSFNGNANDETGNGNDGVVNGATPIADRFGNSNSAYEFTNDIITIDSSDSFILNEFTISCWVRPENFASPMGHLFKRSNLSSGYYLALYQSSGRFQFSGQAGCNIGGNKSLFDLTWHMVTAVFNGSRAYLYLDGFLSDSMDCTYILQPGLSTSIGSSYSGRLDDLGVWGIALSECDIHQLYNNYNDPSFAYIEQNMDNSLSAFPKGQNYQWIDCDNGNSIINGEISDLFYPQYHSNYAVIVSHCMDTDTSDCFNFYESNIQDSLDLGISIAHLLESYPVDSFYCKLSQGGLIFYLNSFTADGMVAAQYDQGISWYDCAQYWWGTTGGSGGGIGDGYSNTLQILDDCPDTIGPAYVCANLELNGYSDWFLPSYGELEAISDNLYDNGCGGFDGWGYWSSTSCGPVCTFFFDSGNNASDPEYDHSYRAVRAFHEPVIGIIENESNLKSTLYPNPVTSILTITGGEKVDGIKIYSSTGQLVLTTDNFENSVDLSNLSSGFYYIIIQRGNWTEGQKFIKK